MHNNTTQKNGLSYIMDRLHAYGVLMRADKPIPLYLLLWPTIWALWISGGGNPAANVLIIFVCGVFLMRSAGCVINDFADRNIDGKVARTQQRPLVTGLVSSHEAIGLFIVLCLIAFSLVFLLNTLTILLACLAIILAIAYPYMKRIIPIPQAFLGLAWYIAIPMAFAAQTNNIPITAWLLYIAVIFWTIAYDTIYALMDLEDDKKIDIKSATLLFGRFDRLAIFISHSIFVSLLVAVGIICSLSVWFFISLFLTLLLITYQMVLIQQREPTQCYQAFAMNHWIGALIFIGLIFS